MVWCKYIEESSLNHKIIFDLPYPNRKPRIFFQSHKISLKEGQKMVCYSCEFKKKGNYIDVKNLNDFFTIGKVYLYQDGEGKFIVNEVSENEVTFTCMHEFEMKTSKAITCDHLIQNQLSNEMIELIQKVNPTQIWFSFVEDTSFVKIMKKKLNVNVEFFMKIENETGIRNLQNILSEECGIVIARGDLALSMDMTQLYDVQQKIIQQSKVFNKKVYIATGFMISMETNKRPTRADIIDLSVAIKSGCDGLMLNASAFRGNNFSNLITIIKKISVQ